MAQSATMKNGWGGSIKRIGLMLVAVLILSSCTTKSVQDEIILSKTENNEKMTTEQPLETVEGDSVVPSNAPIEPTIAPTDKEHPGDESQKLKGRIICVDAGHGINSKNYKEQNAPNSSEMKEAFATGTEGAKYTEEELTLIVAKKLKVRLEEAGAKVVMTRETKNCELSNIGRAQLANDANADFSVRIHADGSSDKSVSGISMLVPSVKSISDKTVLAKSRRLGELVLSCVVRSTGGKNRGVIERSDLTGFNWSTVPVILLEMGFMTNAEDDTKLSTDGYQNKIVSGIVQGIIEYGAQE